MPAPELWRYLNRQLAEIALQRLFALAIAGVARGIGNWLVLVVNQMLGHLGIESLFDQQLGQLLE